MDIQDQPSARSLACVCAITISDLILMKFGMNDMPTSCFLCILTNNIFMICNNIVDLRDFQMEAILAPHNIGS
jgi:hypothetical protein